MKRYQIVFVFTMLTLVVRGQQYFSNECLSHPQKHAREIDSKIELNKVIEISDSFYHNWMSIENGYASYRLKGNDQLNQLDQFIEIDEIHIVFSDYPLQKEDWLTNYHFLLSKRLKELFRYKRTLNDSKIRWKMIVQTKCKNEKEAKQLFHGFKIKYKKNKSPVSETELSVFKKEISNFINHAGGINDSTVVRVFNRNPQWKKSLVIMDWTASMYQYGAQILQWHSDSILRSGIRNIVLFNDGDQKTTAEKKIGKTGGIYYKSAFELKDMIPFLLKVRKQGTGGDYPENDLEAILRGIKQFSDYDEIILIADNISSVRDIRLWPRIKIPVHIILCGEKRFINPQYVNLALTSGGSVHTMERDVTQICPQVGKEVDVLFKTLNYNSEKKRFSLKANKKD